MSTQNDKHPSKMTEAEKQELMKAEPAAFDLPEATAAADPDPALVAAAEGGDPAAAAALGKDPAEPATPAADPAAEPVADPAAQAHAATEGAKHEPDVIPKARFDEVNGKFKDTSAALERERQENLRLKRELEDAKKPPPRDYDGEIKAIQQKYDDGDSTLEEFLGARDKVIEERGAEKGRQAGMKEVATKTEDEKWNDALTEFQNIPGAKEMIDDPIRNAAFNAAVKTEFEATGGKIAYPDLLLAARNRVDASFGVKRDDPHADRKAADARAAAAASGTPPPPVGGTGNRASGPQGVDVKAMKPGTFSKKLTAQQQAELLGGENAL